MDQALITNIKENYEMILGRIETAALRSGRDPGNIRLVVVTKTQPVNCIQAALDAGATRLGENYADESQPKILALASYPAAQWHMIGHIQSRKAHIVAEHFDMVHSLDSLKLAERLNGMCLELGKRMPVLLEFNLAIEETKTGWRVAEQVDLENLIEQIEQMVAMPGLEIRGLMTMPPLSSGLETSRFYFRKLVTWVELLRRRFPATKWNELSMGTSSDFEAAIQEGATMVRMGQAIFGPSMKRNG